MFLKPFRVKTQTAVKGSDRKKLRSDIEQQYPCLTSAQAADLIPGKGDMTQAKIVSHADGDFMVYMFQKNPIFFESFKRLYPTVYTLWKFPDLLPVFTTYAPVMEKLLKGADLMLPGVEIKGEHGPKMFGNLQKGDLVIVRLKGNRAPVMLGEALLSGEDMYMSALRGKGVRTIHILGDHLWEMGDKSQPPLIPDGEDSDSDEDDDPENEIEDKNNKSNEDDTTEAQEGDCQSMDQLTLNEAGEGNTTASLALEGEDNAVDEDEEELGDAARGGMGSNSDSMDPEDMDRLLEFCLKCAIKAKISKSDLPLLASSVLKGFMQPFAEGISLDLKKSSYKKLSKFLQQMEKEGLIKLKHMSKGVDAIAEVDKSHLELRGLKIPEVVPEQSSEECGEEKFEPPQFTDVLCVTANVLQLLAPYGYTKGATLSTQQLRQIITDYVKSNELQTESNKEQVLLDPILAELALTRSEGDQSYLPWNTLVQRIGSKLQAATVIQYPGKPPLLKKGKIDPIKLEVEQRGSKKKVTTVENLESYGIDPREFGKQVQRRVSGSATVVQSEQKNKGLDMQVQGNQINFIVKFLLETYRIPKKYIQAIDKAPKKK